MKHQEVNRPMSEPATELKTKTERHVFSKLTDAKKAELVAEFAVWGLDIFNTTSDTLRGYWLEKKSFETVVYQLRTVDGALLGCTTIKFYSVDFDGKKVTIAKLGLGVHPKARGNKFATRCLMSEFLRVKASSPRVPLYLFSTLIHPVTYKLCCDLLGDQLYPYFKNPSNPAMEKKVAFLTDLFGIKRADNPDPLVYTEHFSALETPEALAYWQQNKRPEVRFFIEHCPRYHDTGDCLVALAELRLGHVLKNMVGTLARNRMDRIRGRKHKFKS